MPFRPMSRKSRKFPHPRAMPAVKVDVKQAEAKDGTAVVKFDYNGVVKTYRVVFASR